MKVLSPLAAAKVDEVKFIQSQVLCAPSSPVMINVIPHVRNDKSV